MSFSSDPALQANQLPISVEFSKDQEKFIEQLTLLYKRIANATNTKTGGLFRPIETAAFDQYFVTSNPQEFRPVYRIAIDTGQLGNAATTTIAHGVSFATTFRMVRYYGAATDPTANTYVCLPFSSPTLNENIKVEVNATNIVITTAIDYSSYTSSTIILEYTKY